MIKSSKELKELFKNIPEDDIEELRKIAQDIFQKNNIQYTSENLRIFKAGVELMVEFIRKDSPDSELQIKGMLSSLSIQYLINEREEALEQLAKN